MSSTDRVIVFAPHPDDESVATGGFLARLARRGSAIRVVFITDGDNNPWPHRALKGKWRLTDADRAEYAAARRSEALAALAILGLPPESALFLGLPDQGLLALQRTSPSVLEARFRQVIEDFRPSLIVGPSSADLHADHWAASQIVRGARRHLSTSALSYIVHGNPPERAPRVHTCLTSAERDLKRRAILAHATQMILSRRRFLHYADEDERLDSAAGRGPIVARPLRRYWFVLRSELRAGTTGRDTTHLDSVGLAVD